MVASDIEKWWERVGVKLKHPATIKWMVDKLVKDYKDLFKRKDREGKEKERRDNFLKRIAKTLWMVTKETEERLKKSTNPKCIVDFKFLEGVRGMNRAAKLGCADSEEVNKNTRKRKRAEQRERNTKKRYHSFDNLNKDQPCSSEEEVDEDDKEFIVNLEKKKTPKKKPTKKKQAITPEFCAAAMMTNTSNRGGFMLVGATIPENELEDTTLSSVHHAP